MIELNCLKHCNAACCRKLPNDRVIFDFSAEEAEMFRKKGATLIPHRSGGFTMTEDCIFLRGNMCSLHATKKQPRCCVDNKVGEELCLRARRAASGKRFSDVE